MERKQLWITNCRYICDARPTVDVETPAPGNSTTVDLDCPWMKATTIRRPIEIKVETDADGKTTASCTEVPLCHDQHENMD